METLIGVVVLVLLGVPVLLVMALVGIGSLKQRLAVVEVELDRLRREVVATGREAPARSPDGLPETWLAPAQTPEPARSSGQPRPPAPGPALPAMKAPADAPRRVEPIPAAARRTPSPATLERLGNTIRRWFTEGNVPVKVGVLVLLAGVAALLKYASDQGWLTLPIEARLAAVAAAALAALGFGWRERARRRAFALAVQGGAIGVLLLVVYAAFRFHGLLVAPIAFALSVGLVAALGVLAVLQESRTMAVLGILAGFLAPIWLSTGTGNHVVLFSYYAVLNAAVFAIAWLRPWRELNLLGWAFTWGIGVAWGVLAYRPGDYASTQPFLLLFFGFYLLIPVLYARRRVAGRRDIVDGGLLFGTPLVAFLLQAALLDGERIPLALCALGLAALYALLALWQRRGPHVVLAEAYVLLAAGFAILAAPLALSARATAAVFAVEGAALVWLGLRQDRRLSRWTGAGLQLAAAIAFVVGLAEVARPATAVANPVFAGALLVAVAGLASAWWCRAAGRAPHAALFYAWGLAWWCGTALQEVEAHVAAVFRADVLLGATAVTALLAAEAHRRRPARALAWTVTAAFVLAGLLVFAQLDARGQPLALPGALAWLLFAACGLRALASLREGGGDSAPWAQFAWLLAWPVLLHVSGHELAHTLSLGEGWRLAFAALPWLALLAMLRFRWNWLRQPMGMAFDGLRDLLGWTCLLVVGTGWLAGLASSGDSAPLPWLPLLNPLDAVQLAALALCAAWLWWDGTPGRFARQRVSLLSVAGVLLATCITLRTVHHWGGVSWGTALWSSSLAQTALTLVWSALGVAGWIAGSRRGQRGLWLAGAVLMAVVLVKLVLVDRQHLGNLLGIGSFMAFGLLCTVVGWFAPAPPRGGGGDGGPVGAEVR